MMTKLKTRGRVPRNAPCPCNSGKRYKHCHGALQLAPPGTQEREVRALLQNKEASEILRKNQQGHGQPIISILHAGHRFVGIGKRVMFSREWRYFPDFLLENLKHVLGRDWGESASKSMPDHPLFRWLRRLQQAKNAVLAGNHIPLKGHISALMRLSYALYLIEHNDKIPKSLIKRLKNPNDFDPACYEALVASAFALAGSVIEGAEDTKGNKPKPEFFAFFKSGKSYAVEAKRKRIWSNPFNVDSKEFVEELRMWLRNKLHAAAKKELDNPVYWLELSIGETLTLEQAERLRQLISETLADAESMTVRGNPARPAYVVVTNNADFANDDAVGLTQFALFMGFRMEDFREGLLDLETAMERHDNHRDIRRVLECIEEVQQVPTNFDGIPDDLVDESGQPISTLKIGDLLTYPNTDGTDGIGRITEITSIGNEAYVAVYEEKSRKSSIIKVPLTEQETKAAEKLGDAIFGKPVGPKEKIDDPLRLYDRLLEMHAKYDREYLLRQLQKYPDIEQFRTMSDESLRVRVARETTKMLVSLA